MNSITSTKQGLDFFRTLLDAYEERFPFERLIGILMALIDSIIILFISWASVNLLRVITGKVTDAVVRRSPASLKVGRIHTLKSLLDSAIKYSIYLVALIAILKRCGVNTGAIVAASAVIGGALAFGSQGLIQDVITGLSILFENQLAVGDFVEISGKFGLVEEVGLRTTKIRDMNGEEHIIFNRNIAMVSNFTHGYIDAIVDVNLADEADAVRAQKLLDDLGSSIARELPVFIEPPKVTGVENSDIGELFVRMKAKVVPLQQDFIKTELVERIKFIFARENIIIPQDRVRIMFGNNFLKEVLSQMQRQ